MATSFNSRSIVNDENSFPDFKKAAVNPQSYAQENKRAALSVISENLPKQANEKVFAKSDYGKSVQFSSHIPTSVLQPNPNFAIFQDSPIADLSEPESICDLPDNVTKLYRHEIATLPPPSAEMLYDVCEDSPMILDLSLDSSRISSEKIFHLDEYDEDIYTYLRNFEKKYRPSVTYMKKQTNITAENRDVLVDWLVEVCESYKMETATLYNAVAYTDRFLSYMSVSKEKLQLVGTACLFIASKYEEIYPPELKEFVYVTDDSCSKRQILRMEQLILKVLGFNLSCPTAYEFIQRYCLKCFVSEEIHSLALYICEMSLYLCETFLSFLPSIVAAASLCLAIYTLGNLDPWTSIHEEVTGYKLEDIEQCIKCLVEAYSMPSNEAPYPAITEKYSSSKHHCVSKLPPPHIIQTDIDDENDMKST